MRATAFCSSILAAITVIAFLAEKSHAAFDPLAVYGPEHRFTILRNDEVVGKHLVRFENLPGGLSVEARFELQIKFLFFTAYRYEYESVAEWRDGRLARLEAKTNDNGENKFVSAELRDDGMIHIDGTKGRFVADAGIMPTNHWNPEVVTRQEVLNSINGNINSVVIEDRGEEAVETSTGRINARRYVYSGELENEVWYDSQGRWVKMRFKARDGSIVDYLCDTCGESQAEEISLGG